MKLCSRELQILHLGVLGATSRCPHPDSRGADLHIRPEVLVEAQLRGPVGSLDQIRAGERRWDIRVSDSHPATSIISHHSQHYWWGQTTVGRYWLTSPASSPREDSRVSRRSRQQRVHHQPDLRHLTHSRASGLHLLVLQWRRHGLRLTEVIILIWNCKAK